MTPSLARRCGLAYTLGMAFMCGYLYARRAKAADAWEESEHPRGKGGKFAKGGAGSASADLSRPYSAKSDKELYGPEITLAKPDPAKAIDALVARGRGHVKAAVTRRGIGGIDLIWGDDACGLRHMIKQRAKDGPGAISDIKKALPHVLAHGALVDNDPGDPSKSYTLTWLPKGSRNGYKAVVTKRRYNGNQLRFVVTAYKQARRKMGMRKGRYLKVQD